MTVYAPETKDCDSANIKRGLVNLLEFYDFNTKTISKISEFSSSGNCSELVTTNTQTDNEVTLVTKLTDVQSNCTSKWTQILKKS